MAGSKRERGILQNIKPFNLKKNRLGMVQNRAETFLNPSEAVNIQNMYKTEEGSWSADNAGYSVVNASGTAYESGASTDGLVWFTDSTQVDHLFIAINGKLKEINLTTGADSNIDATAGYTVGAQVDFQALNNVLFTCDGNIATPRKWDGSAAANSSGWPVVNGPGTETYTYPKYVEEHQGRLAYAYFNGAGSAFLPSHLLLSDQNNGESFTFTNNNSTNAYVDEVGLGDGQAIVGMRSIHVPASNESALVIVKNRSIYSLTGNSATAGDPDQFKVVKVNGNYGAFNNRCIVQVGNDLLMLNEFGVISYSSANQSGTIQPVGINSDNVIDTIASINLSAKAKCWGIHLPNRREVWFGVPTGSATQVDKYIVYKYPTPGDPNSLPAWSVSTDSGSAFKMAHGVLYNRTFYVGSYTGIVGQMFNASKYGSTGIPWRYEMPYWDAGNEKQYKRLLSGTAHFKVRSVQTFTLQTQWKGGGDNGVQTQTLTITTTTNGATYGTATYGTDYYGSQEEVKVPYLAAGNGERLKHTISGTTTTTGPEFLGLTPVIQYGAISHHWN